VAVAQHRQKADRDDPNINIAVSTSGHTGAGVDNPGDDTVIHRVDDADSDAAIARAGNAAGTPAAPDTAPGVPRRVREGRKLR
jgi:hypothetical protein